MKIVKFLIFVCLVLVALPVQAAERTINVDGIGKASAKPDRAEIRLSVISNEATAAEAIASVSEKARRVLTHSRNHAAHFGQCDSAVINGHFDEMMAEARADLAGEGFAPEQIRLQRTMDVRYLGELGVLTLSMPEDETFADGMTATEALFDQAHERAFTFADPDCERELMGLEIGRASCRERV